MKNQTARRKTAKKQTETTPKRHTNRRLTGKFTYSDFDKNNKNTFTSCVEISKSKNIKKAAACYVIGHNKLDTQVSNVIKCLIQSSTPQTLVLRTACQFPC